MVMVIRIQKRRGDFMDKKIVKQKILDFEYFNFTAGGSLCSRDVEVLNLRLRKDKAIADIILHDYEENYQERHNNCEYDYQFLQNRG